MRTKTLIHLISFLVLLLLFDVSCGMDNNEGGEESTKVEEDFEMTEDRWKIYIRDLKIQAKRTTKKRDSRPPISELDISINMNSRSYKYPRDYKPEVKGHSVAKRTLWKKFVSEWLTIVPDKDDVVIMEPFGGMGVHIDVPDGDDNEDMSKLIIESGSIVAAYEAACNTRRKKTPVKFYIGEKTDLQKNFVNMLMYYVRSQAREYCSTDPSSITVKSADFTQTTKFVGEVLEKYDGHHALMMVDPYSMQTAPLSNLVAFFMTEGRKLRTLVTNFFPKDIFIALQDFDDQVRKFDPNTFQSGRKYMRYLNARAKFSKTIKLVLGYDDPYDFLNDVSKKMASMSGAGENEDDRKEVFKGQNLLRKLSALSRDNNKEEKLARVLANVHRERLIELTQLHTKLFTGDSPFDVAFWEYNRHSPMYITYCLTTISVDACNRFDKAVERLMVSNADEDDDTGTFRSYRLSSSAEDKDGRRHAYFRDNGSDLHDPKSAVFDDDDTFRFKERRDEDNGGVLLP